ncbi:hypothetical protein A6A22_15960 [Arthrobacter sp. OY3WO11]|nr:hypothetical protein A6A22_15960 [Arthrobacter sp. OY3WO11]
MPVKARRRIMYFRVTRRHLRLGRPRLFTEKINWRIVNDRRDILSGTCDKIWMQDFARDAGVKVPNRIWVGTSLAELAEVDLPARWVLKPNHSSGRVHFGEGKANLAELQAVTKGWLYEQTSVTLADEWAYGEARKCFIAEERLGQSDIDLPDYKFFVFHGKPELIQVDSSRFSGHERRLYTPDWEPLEVVNIYPLGPVIPKPATLDQMLAAAAMLGQPFDFIRVDFYEVGGEVIFGELTPYPGGGIEPYSPRSLDAVLGSKWTLPQLQQY